MADLEFNQQDIVDLAQKLATLWDDFSDKNATAAGHLRECRGQVLWPEAQRRCQRLRLGPGTGSRSR